MQSIHAYSLGCHPTNQMSLASLPPEIFHLILQYCSTATLVALVSVSKAISRDAISVLYHDPLRCILRLAGPTPLQALTRLTGLLATLTNSPRDPAMSASDFFQALRARAEGIYTVTSSSALEQGTELHPTSAPAGFPGTSLSGISYLSIVRHIRFPYEVPRAAGRNTAREFSINYQQNESLYLQVLFSWTLVDPIAEQLESLTIPVPDIDRYIASVGRFRSLTSVKFDMRVFLPYSEPPWTLFLERIVAFLGLHSHLFKDKLENTGYEGIAAFSWTDILRMMRVLPPLKYPVRLVDETLVRFISQPERTNLDKVRFIHDRIPMNHLAMNMNWRQDLHRQKRFFHRCRSLEVLRWSITDPNSFAWAVREKKQREIESVSAWAPLVPLKEAILTVQGDTHGKVISDIFTAFGDTLERAYIAYTDPRTERLLVARGCHFPRLRRLVISVVSGGPLVIDSEALRVCPALEQLELSDKSSSDQGQYPSDDLQWVPCVLPKATLIILVGTLGRNFHMDTLYSTPGLQKLSLLANIPKEPIAGSWDIPRPLSLAWDWKLPHLEKLCVNAEFAYHFEFKWLQDCPMLRKLEIEIPSYWRRILSLDDLRLDRGDLDCRGPLNTTDNPSPALPVPQFVRSVSLSTLRLSGQWFIEASVLQVLITEVAPNLIYISEEECLGFSTQEWIDVMKTGSRLSSVYSYIDLPPPDAAIYGLLPVNRTSRSPETSGGSKSKGKGNTSKESPALEGPLFQFYQIEQAYRWKRPTP